MKKADLVGLGKVLRSQGKDGELKLRLYETLPSGFSCHTIYLRRSGGDQAFGVESIRVDRNATFLKLKGVDTLAQSDLLVGLEVLVPRECFRPLEGGGFYHFQVLGSRVVTREGTEVGIVSGILPAGSAHVLTVDRAGRELYLPFTEAICVRVDPEAGVIVIDPPDGLLELNEI